MWVVHVIQSHREYGKCVGIPKETVFGFSSSIFILDYGMELYLGLYEVSYSVLFSTKFEEKFT